MHPPHRTTTRRVSGAQVRGQLGEPGQQPGRVLGRQLPHHAQPGRLPVRVLRRHTGLARTPHPGQHHHPRPRPRRPPGRQPGIQPGQQLLPARQVRRPRRQPHRHPATTWPHARASAAFRGVLQGGQRLEQQRLQPVRGIHPLNRDPSLHDPVPERPLPLPVHRIGQEHARQRQHRVLIQHEHQPRQSQLPGRGELQLRIRHTGLVLDRRAVPEPDDPRVHIGLPDLLTAIGRWLVLPGGEIRHVQYHPASPGHRMLGRSHERPARRIPAQLGGVTQEHPQRPLHKRSRYRDWPSAQPRNQPGSRSASGPGAHRPATPRTVGVQDR